MKRIAVIGLGQIGGSIVQALSRSPGRYSIAGIDPSSQRRKMLDSCLASSSKNWNDAKGSDLTVICLHYDLTIQYLKQADPQHLCMDVCSGKSKIVQLANRRKLRWVGGHPMAGNEFKGEKGWRENLFEDAPFFLCPAKRVRRNDLTLVRSFARALGATPLLVDPKIHDRFVAITSHFPALLSKMLQQMGKKVPKEFRGPGFRSMTRLAETSPELVKTFLASNNANIRRSAKELQSLLDRWLKRK